MSIKAINISGQALRSQSVRFSSISENIANLNTTGYKKGKVTFSEQIGGETKDVQSAGYNAGGQPGPTSTSQNFSGMKANLRRNHVNDATIINTGRSLDVAIRGPGQLIVREFSGENNDVAGQTYLTSAGNLQLLPWYSDGIRQVSSEGLYLADQNGHQVMGVAYNESTQTFDTPRGIDSLKPIRVNKAVSKEATPPILSSIFKFNGNLKSNARIGEKVVISTNFYNGMGKINAAGDGRDPTINDTVPMSVSLQKIDNNVWSIAFLNNTLVNGKEVGALTPSEYPDALKTPLVIVRTEAQQRASGWKIQFDGEGKPLRMWSGTSKFPNPTDKVLDPTQGTPPKIELQYTRPTDAQLLADPVTGKLPVIPPGEPKYKIATTSLSVDTRGTTSYGGSNTISITQNGRSIEVRQFVNFGIENDGVIYRYFDDKSKVPLAKLAYGTVASLSNLTPVSGTLLRLDADSGALKVNTFDGNRNSSLLVGSLETSNVDLAEEFSEMILNQRAYSLSTKTLTTAIEMNERAVQLKK